MEQAPRASIHEATKEQLIDIVRQLKQQIKDLKAVTVVRGGGADGANDAEVKELQDQIAGFQNVVQEKNDEIQALRMQCRMLTEKCASDESTINTLLRRLEEMQTAGTATGSRTTNTPSASTTPVLQARPATSSPPEIPWKASSSTSGAQRHEDRRGVEGGGGSNTTISQTQINSLNTQLSAANAALSTKHNEMVKLETQLRELMEVNSFYAAIVSQHDKDELVRKNTKDVHQGQHSTELTQKSGSTGMQASTEDDPMNTTELMKRITLLEDQRGRLHRVLRQVENEKNVFVAENQQLRSVAERLEEEMLEVGRWTRVCEQQARAFGSSVHTATPEADDFRLPSKVRGEDLGAVNETVARERIPAKVVRPAVTLSLAGPSGSGSVDRRGLNFSPLAGHSPFSNSRGGSVSDGGGGFASSAAGSFGPDGLHVAGDRGSMAALGELRALKPIHIRNPDAQERELLRRLELYEKYVSDADTFERDRQKNFDEMERARAELFANMNEQLERQRREIRQLRKERDQLRESSVPSTGTQPQEQAVVLVSVGTHGAASSPAPSATPSGEGTPCHNGEEDAKQNSAQIGEVGASTSALLSYERLLQQEERRRLELELSAAQSLLSISLDAVSDTHTMHRGGFNVTKPRASPQQESCEGEREGMEAVAATDDVASLERYHETKALFPFMNEFHEAREAVALDVLLQLYGDCLCALAASLRADEADVKGSTAEGNFDIGTVLDSLLREKKTTDQWNGNDSSANRRVYEFRDGGAQDVLDSLFSGATGFTGHLAHDPNERSVRTPSERRDKTGGADNHSSTSDTNDALAEKNSSHSELFGEYEESLPPNEEQPQTPVVTGTEDGYHESTALSTRTSRLVGETATGGQCNAGSGEPRDPSVDTASVSDRQGKCDEGFALREERRDSAVRPSGSTSVAASQSPSHRNQLTLGDGLNIHLELYEESGEDADERRPDAVTADGEDEGHLDISPDEETELLMQLECALADPRGGGTEEQMKGASAPSADEDDEGVNSRRTYVPDACSPSAPLVHPSTDSPVNRLVAGDIRSFPHGRSEALKEEPKWEEVASSQVERSPSPTSHSTDSFHGSLEDHADLPHGPPRGFSSTEDLPDSHRGDDEESVASDARLRMPRIATAPGFEFDPMVSGPGTNVPKEWDGDVAASTAERLTGGTDRKSSTPHDSNSYVSPPITEGERMEDPVLPAAFQNVYTPPTSFPPNMCSNRQEAKTEAVHPTYTGGIVAASQTTTLDSSGRSTDCDGADFHADFSPFA